METPRKILLTLLDASEFGVTPMLRQRIEDCSDLAQPEAWITEFVTDGRLDTLAK